jgi:hypothetical protein
MANAPPGWLQGPDGKWYQEYSQEGPTNGFRGPNSDSSGWSRGKKLRVGLLVAGFAYLAAGVGSLIYSITLATKFNYPGFATFGSIIAATGAMLFGAAIVWIASAYVQV